MELRHPRYFVAVALELHMGRAARRLFISQPALSQQVRSLEHELGLRLPQRNRRGVRLTPEGEAFLVEARAVVQQADHALEVARALSEGATGHLRMSYVLTTPGGLPELIVSEYQRRYPGVQISFDSGSTAQNLERLRRGEVDVAFAHNPAEDNADLGWIEIGTQPLMVALPSAHPLSRRRRLQREHLAGVPLVYVPRHSSPGVYDSILAQVYGARPPDVLRTEPTMERVLVAVSEGVGVTLLLEERAAMLRRPGVTFRRFTEPEPSVALGVAFPQPPCILLVSSARAEDELRDWDRPLPLWSIEPVGKLGRPSLVLPRARTVAWTALRVRIPQGWARADTFRVWRNYGGS